MRFYAKDSSTVAGSGASRAARMAFATPAIDINQTPVTAVPGTRNKRAPLSLGKVSGPRSSSGRASVTAGMVVHGCDAMLDSLS